MAEFTALTIDLSTDQDPQPAATPLDLASASSLAGLRDGVLHLLRSELRDFVLADDLCNETFRIVLERLRLQPLDDPGRISSYLAQTARNLAIAYRRKEKRQHTVTGHEATLEALGVADLDPAVIVQSQSRAAAVRRVLEEIPQVRDREILVRVYLYDQDKEQVCRELGIGADHYKRVVHRARERFRTLIEQRHARSDLYSLAFI
jgi:RNA polymerase sigma-70 factor (ECF subfamily)